MLIAAIVTGIIIFIFAPTLYFMITRRSKRSDYDAFHADTIDNSDQTSTIDYSQQKSPPEVFLGYDQDAESDVIVERISGSKNPMNHFK